MATEYRTVQGDTFDLIAWRLFGNEHLCGKLMQANPEEMDTIIFSAGETVNVPEMEIQPAKAKLPPWYGKNNG